MREALVLWHQKCLLGKQSKRGQTGEGGRQKVASEQEKKEARDFHETSKQHQQLDMKRKVSRKGGKTGFSCRKGEQERG